MTEHVMANHNTTANNDEGGEINFLKEEIEKLKALLGSTSIARSGDHKTFLDIHSSLLTVNFILDTSVTDHMTPKRSKFTTYYTRSGKKNIFTASVEILLVAVMGSLEIKNVGTLNNVLHVPNLKMHLISPQQLVKDINCRIILAYGGCFMYDKGSNQKIRPIKEKYGLLYFEENSVSMLTTDGLKSSEGDDSRKQDQIKLIHYRLRYPSSKRLRIMFPSHVKHCDVTNIIYDAR